VQDAEHSNIGEPNDGRCLRRSEGESERYSGEGVAQSAAAEPLFVLRLGVYTSRHLPSPNFTILILLILPFDLKTIKT
jgi:hypothetical protein